MPMPSPDPVRWLDRFFESYYERRPVNATFIGEHEHDERLPDFSENGTGDGLAKMKAQLASVPDPPGAERAVGLDLLLARGFLNLAIWEHESLHFHRGNPSLYTGEAVFGVMSLFLTPGPTGERVKAARARMESIPAFLAQSRENVRSAPEAWIQRAVRECDGALQLFTEGVAKLREERDIRDRGFERAAETAAAAFANHRAYLSAERGTAPTHPVGCGEEALALHSTLR